jgi:hypothetical protein
MLKQVHSCLAQSAGFIISLLSLNALHEALKDPIRLSSPGQEIGVAAGEMLTRFTLHGIATRREDSPLRSF